MLSMVRSGGKSRLQMLALALVLGMFNGSSTAGGLDCDGPGCEDQYPGWRFKPHSLEEGTLGWAEYGVYPGLYGFSLRWHPGYGYGRYALGVGADGGYPFYGGPGYPHLPPCLNRFGPTEPYVYFGGPDYPIFGWSNFFQEFGGRVITEPVVTIGEPGDFGYVNERGEVGPGTDFGQFTGSLPYPETLFAPYASAAANTGSSGAEGAAKPATPAATSPPLPSTRGPSASLSPARGGGFGAVFEPVVEADGTRGVTVIVVQAGSPAETAGLRPGDVIKAANGYLTTARGNLAWIISKASPDDILSMRVRTATDGQEHIIAARLVANTVNTDRPSYLPRVGNGPPPATR